MESHELEGILKEYFEKREDILMAFLFGSYAKAISHRESDVDIAVYFRPRSGFLEWAEFDI
jgi:predicted nucleotidyltransferase